MVFLSTQSNSYNYIFYQVNDIRYADTSPNYYHLPIHAVLNLHAKINLYTSERILR